MANSSDVLIAGGGIIGCSIAYHLAQLGIKSTIIERESIGSQASGAATGLLVALKEAGAPEPFTRLIEESCKRHKEIIPEVEELSKIDAQYGTSPGPRSPALTTKNRTSRKLSPRCLTVP